MKRKKGHEKRRRVSHAGADPRHTWLRPSALRPPCQPLSPPAAGLLSVSSNFFKNRQKRMNSFWIKYVCLIKNIALLNIGKPTENYCATCQYSKSKTRSRSFGRFSSSQCVARTPRLKHGRSAWGGHACWLSCLTHILTQSHTYMHTHTHSHKHTHMHAHSHIHTYIHIHTHIHA